MFFKKNELKISYLYFYIHFIVEVVCFYYLSVVTNNSSFIWLIPFIYDGLAFVPQGVIGYLVDKYKKLNVGYIGIFLLIISYLIFGLTNLSIYISLILLCFGNAFLHIGGAESTIRYSDGRLSPVSIFVAGGSFGVITGKILANFSLNPLIMLVLIISVIPCLLLVDSYSSECIKNKSFNYVKKNINSGLVIIIAIFVIIVRGYMGYGIPTTWNKTLFQTVLFYFTMGIGKALGGILSDYFGIKKVAIFSVLLSISFLCFGDNIMVISLIGIMFFSMTMAITLGILVSVLKNAPGLAFGLTTIGLFLGTLPIFFVKLDMLLNIIIIVSFSIICVLLLNFVLCDGDK